MHRLSEMLLELEHVEVGYHRRAILPKVSLRIERGSFWGIVGPNGSGKTTLVRTLLRLLPPVQGEIRFPNGRRPRIGYVPQREQTDATWPLTALEIALMSRYPRIGVGRRPRTADVQAARAALDKVGIADLAGKLFHALSGGQRQRVLTARALAGEPELLVLDEPTNGMDLLAERAMLDLIASFAAQSIAVIMVSHVLEAIANYAQNLVLVDRDRGLVEVGPTSEILTGQRLSRLYNAPVAVSETHGYKAVFVDKPRGSG
jgi:ABC-type Mn2+/Zn2+ transport system ATPase subunit